MYKMLLEEIDLRFSIRIGRYRKPLRARPGAGWYRHTAVSAVRAEAAGAFAKGQDSTLAV
jgi:hypothetical protein